jgi:CheY-like chemotaxis protein
MARDSLSQQSVSSIAAFTPGNQQQINVFEAGPSFFARFGQTTLGQLDLRYTNSYAEETQTFNSDRYTAAARLTRELSATDRISGNLEGTRTEYDSISELYDYERYDAFVIDWIVGETSTVKLIAAIRAQDATCPIVVLTAQVLAGVVQESEIAQAVASFNFMFAEKPVRMTILSASLARAFAAR